MSDFATRDHTTGRAIRVACLSAARAARKKKAEAMIGLVKENLKPVEVEDAPKKKKRRSSLLA